MSSDTHSTKACIVLANGAFPNHQIPLAKLNSELDIICCDGASDKLVAYGLKPRHIVGDLDSASESVKAEFADRLVHVSSQENNDLTKAIDFAVNCGYNEITILGATGLREDHTLGNLALLAEHSTKAKLEIVSDFGHFTAHQKHAVLDTSIGQQVSIFAINQAIVSSKGLKYELHHLLLNSWWKGTLNQAEEQNIELTIENDKLILVYRVHPE